MKAAIIERSNPHCVAWMHATMSLWGMSSGHDLDEPVRISAEVPVRLRFPAPAGIIADREVSLKAERNATHVAIRFYFRDGSFTEFDIDEIRTLGQGATAYFGKTLLELAT